MPIPEALCRGAEQDRTDDSEKSGIAVPLIPELYHLEVVMWSKPEYTEMRFGFEVTMYIANR